jgi:hypothetical protein
MELYERIIAAHTDVTSAVSHSARIKSNRYFVWQEDGKNDLEADGKHTESCIIGYTDLFTKQEFDPWIDELGESFDKYGIAWSLRTIQYEEDTGFYHYTWDWEVA